MTINLLKKSKKIKKNIDELYKEQYSNWKNQQKSANEKFFILYKNFDTHLKDIHPGALKLYLYYGFHSKNETGESWHSIDTISNYFDVSGRTINSWNKILEQRGLIARSNTKAKSKTTYLLPFSPNVINVTDVEDFTSRRMTDKSFKETYGSICKGFHFFQWRTKKGSDKYDVPFNIIAIIFKKEFEESSQITIFQYNLSDIKYTEQIKFTGNISDDINLFKSDVQVPDTELELQGIIVNSIHNLRTPEIFINIVTQLMHPEIDLEEFEEVELR